MRLSHRFQLKYLRQIAKTMDEEEEIFHSDLRCTHMTLFTPADIVQYSFLVQPSISSLNLEIGQNYTVWNCDMDPDFPTYTYSNDFINTKEKCLKVLPRGKKLRTFLEILHLDLPRGREGNLKDDSQSEDMNISFTNPYFARIFIHGSFYPSILYSFIDNEIERTDQLLPLLKWFINTDVLESNFYYQLPLSVISYIIDYMHPELEDLRFVRNCFKKLNLLDWLESSGSSISDRVTTLFYQFHRIGRSVYVNRTCSVWTEEFIDCFLAFSSFKLVGDFLKLKSAPSFSDGLYNFITRNILEMRGSMILNKTAEKMSRQRHILLLQIVWVYLKHSGNNSAASEFLYLIWNSVPDSFISSDEFLEAFSGELSLEEIDNVYNFYTEAVGGTDVSVEPRRLKHYCRTVIRKKLHERKCWLPEGIQKTGLPRLLQSYANLGREYFISI